MAIIFSITITLPRHANYGQADKGSLCKFIFLKVLSEYRRICLQKYQPEYDEFLARFLIVQDNQKFLRAYQVLLQQLHKEFSKPRFRFG